MAPLPPTAFTPTIDAIYRAYEAREASKPPRSHLGASEIGKECEREIWLRFRWALPQSFEGRMLRLFETGHLEEARLKDNLRDIGIEVHAVDPGTGRQWSFQTLGGHFSGSADGVVLGLLEAPKTFHLFEAKTHNLKSFSALLKSGVAKSKPEHYAQMVIYMHMLGLTRAAYFAVCKDDDRIYLERVHANPNMAKEILHKAERIIFAASPPDRVSLDPDAFGLCKWCDFRALCHPQVTPEPVFPARNCRTCVHSTPLDEPPVQLPDGGHAGRWGCVLRGEIKGEIQSRCCGGDHRYHPALVQGEQVDADETTRGISYVLKDGREWVDTGQKAG